MSNPGLSSGSYPFGTDEKVLGSFAKQFAIEFDVNDNNGLEMNFHDAYSPRPYKFPTSEGPLVLAFDNYCAFGPGYNDFLHYYEWVQDVNSRSPSRKADKFVAGKALVSKGL
ncbi:MAG: hypothetical protein IPG67_02770 [Acidobacteria bacterium]|nr:hypothetical protein [Acidobacteriota bacterium]